MAVKSKMLCIPLLLAGSSLFAQDPAFLGLQYDYTFTGEVYHSAGGINLEGAFGKHFSVNFSALYGPITSDQFYFYTGGGQALGVYLIDNAFRDGGGALALTLGIFSFAMPESIAYRIRLSDEFQVAIFLAPYGYELIRNTNAGESRRRSSYELGIRFYLDIKNWISIIPRIGSKGFYGESANGGSFGMAIMFKVD